MPVNFGLRQVQISEPVLLVAFVVLAATLPCAARRVRSRNADCAIPAAQPSHWAEQVVLGSSTVELTGPWKFHKGDNMDWAQPDFNDSGWAAMDLTPPPRDRMDPFLGTSGFVPGWTVLGAAGYSGYAWYRLKVNVQYDRGLTEGGLELKMPDDVDDAYQVYVNGALIGEFGQFTPERRHVVSHAAAHLRSAYGISRAARSRLPSASGWIPLRRSTNPDTGGLHGPPVLGQASTD